MPGKRRENKKANSLPVLHIPIPLRQLRPEIDNVAPEQQVVLRLDRQSVAHKGARVHDQGARHATGYTIVIIHRFSDPGRQSQTGVCEGKNMRPERERETEDSEGR